MSSVLRSLLLCLGLFAMLAQTGCQMRGGSGSASAPYNPSQVVHHTVKVGETLSSIAQLYGVSVVTLVDANSIRDRNLRPGTDLVIPGGKLAETIKPSPEAENEKPVVTPPAETWYISRAEWALQPVVLSRTTPMGGTPTRITVHHSGDKDDLNADSLTWLRQVDLNHIKGLNHPEPWACIGYHFIIDPSGKVYEGRPLKYQGAHAGNPVANHLNIGICLMGNFDVQRVPPAQRSALLTTLDRLCLQYGISRAEVFGHKHFKVTECPGKFLSQIIEAYAQRDGARRDDEPVQAAIPTGATRLGAVLPARK